MSERASVRVVASGVRTEVQVAGEIDIDNATRVASHLEAAAIGAGEQVTVDLRRVGYLDSAGLRVLFLLGRDLSRRSVELVLVAPAGTPARQVLELAGATGIATLAEGA